MVKKRRAGEKKAGLLNERQIDKRKAGQSRNGGLIKEMPDGQ